MRHRLGYGLRLVFFKKLEQEETEKTELAFFLRFLCFVLLNSKWDTAELVPLSRITLATDNIGVRSRSYPFELVTEYSFSLKGFNDHGAFHAMDSDSRRLGRLAGRASIRGRSGESTTAEADSDRPG